MHRRLATICNKKGLHARAAAKFVKLAGEFEADIWVRHHAEPAQKELMEYDDTRVNARSILGLMMLGAGAGAVLELSSDHEKAPEALDAIVSLIERRFEEDE